MTYPREWIDPRIQRRAGLWCQISLMSLLAAGGVRAEEPGLADAVHLGGLATLAPLCGLRDDAWAADLRRSLLQGATGTGRTDDSGLLAAPGRGQADAALGFADIESLEDFAEQAPAEACRKVASDPDLRRADAAVLGFRQRAGRGETGF
jgi:hypothetical protein